MASSICESAGGISTRGAGQVAQSDKRNSSSCPRGNGRWSNLTTSSALSLTTRPALKIEGRIALIAIDSRKAAAGVPSMRQERLGHESK